MVLLTWGCKLSMSHVDDNLVKQFIKENAIRGPEQISFDGDFDDQLIEKSEVVSDESDSVLCRKQM